MLGCDWAGLVDAQWDSTSYILSPGVKNRFFFLNNISLTWHSLIYPYFAIIPPWKKMWPFISTFQHIWVPFTQGYSVLSLVEIGQVVLEKKSFESRQRNVFSLCGYYLPLKNTWTTFKNLLLKNHLANFNQTWHRVSLYKRDSNMLKWRVTSSFKGG